MSKCRVLLPILAVYFIDGDVFWVNYYVRGRLTIGGKLHK